MGFKHLDQPIIVADIAAWFQVNGLYAHLNPLQYAAMQPTTNLAIVPMLRRLEEEVSRNYQHELDYAEDTRTYRNGRLVLGSFQYDLFTCSIAEEVWGQMGGDATVVPEYALHMWRGILLSCHVNPDGCGFSVVEDTVKRSKMMTPCWASGVKYGPIAEPDHRASSAQIANWLRCALLREIIKRYEDAGA